VPGRLAGLACAGGLAEGPGIAERQEHSSFSNRFEGGFHKGCARGGPRLFASCVHDFSGTWVEGCFRQDPYTATFATTRAKCGFSDD
jgi:hypothetical protein